jgi:hypothetical protein
MKEIWKDIEGYEGYYKVSNLGRVKSVGRWRRNGVSNSYFQKKKVLEQGFKHNRYGRVSLYKNNLREDVLVHRLVAETFIPNPENKPQVNHKDNDSKNNTVDNLEWVTSSENIIHAYKIGVSTPPMQNKKHTKKSRIKMSNSKKGIRAHNASFTDNEARDIISRKIKGEKRKDVWFIYKDKITETGFQNIWYHKAYKNIWREII